MGARAYSVFCEMLQNYSVGHALWSSVYGFGAKTDTCNAAQLGPCTVIHGYKNYPWEQKMEFIVKWFLYKGSILEEIMKQRDLKMLTLMER